MSDQTRDQALAAITAAAITLSRHESALAAMAQLSSDATPEEHLLRPLAEKAFAFSRHSHDAGSHSARCLALSDLIKTRLLGIHPDDQDIVLEDEDWADILVALSSKQEEAVPVAWMYAEHVESYRSGATDGIAWASPQQTEFYTVPLYAAPVAAIAQAPAIRALEWGKTTYGTPEVATIVGIYRLNPAGNGGWSAGIKNELLRDSDGRTNFATVEAAKAAAQADYERRIRSVLVPATQAKGSE